MTTIVVSNQNLSSPSNVSWTRHHVHKHKNNKQSLELKTTKFTKLFYGPFPGHPGEPAPGQSGVLDFHVVNIAMQLCVHWLTATPADYIKEMAH